MDDSKENVKDFKAHKAEKDSNNQSGIPNETENKVESLFGGGIPGVENEKIVKILEKLLEKAKAGELRSLIVVSTLHNDHVAQAIYSDPHEDPIIMIGSLHVVLQRFSKYYIENQEEDEADDDDDDEDNSE